MAGLLMGLGLGLRPSAVLRPWLRLHPALGLGPGLARGAAHLWLGPGGRPASGPGPRSASSAGAATACLAKVPAAGVGEVTTAAGLFGVPALGPRERISPSLPEISALRLREGIAPGPTPGSGFAETVSPPLGTGAKVVVFRPGCHPAGGAVRHPVGVSTRPGLGGPPGAAYAPGDLSRL